MFINGHEIGGVIEFQAVQDAGSPMTVELRVIPTSMIQGEPPSDEIERLHQQVVSDPTATIDITKAIEQAKARVERGTGGTSQVDEGSEASR